MATLTRRALLQSAALAASGVAAPFVSRAAAAAGKVTPAGKMTLAWHTNIAPRWLDPQQHDGTATPGQFHQCRARRADQELPRRNYTIIWRWPSISSSPRTPEARRSGCATGSSSTTARRSRRRTSNGATRTTAAPGRRCCTRGPKDRDPIDERTDPLRVQGDRFSIFRVLLGTANICGAGWVVPAKYYREGRHGRVRRKSRSAPDPTSSSRRSPGTRLDIRGVRGLLPRRCTSSEFDDPQRARGGDPAWRCSSATKPISSIRFRGELVPRVKRNPKIMLAPVVSGIWWLEFPGFQDPKNPFHDKRVRQAVSLAIDRKAINEAECGGLGKVERQLDQRRCRIRARMAGMGVQCRQGQGADGGGRPPERLSMSTG